MLSFLANQRPEQGPAGKAPVLLDFCVGLQVLARDRRMVKPASLHESPFSRAGP